MIFAAISLAGCATVKNNYVPRTEQISFPALNVEQTATIGDKMLEQGTATTTKGVFLPRQNNISGVVLSQGFYPQTGEDDEHVFTRFAIGSSDPNMGQVTLQGGVFNQNTYPQGIRFEKENQKTCVVVPGVYGISQNVCDTEYSYEFTERPIISQNNFQQTLIYSGRVGDRIRVSYREFSGNMARAAFTNEAEYDLSKSDMIAYKGAKIRIIDANNEQIRYEVLSNFNLTN
uniref:hypothetical protein n=1 Tax=Parerythrobacter lutipelagi TaxID=1964208 RepID=UPI0010F7BD7E|nr:hypothetical protein [Parerythrobacter lutipelagi]